MNIDGVISINPYFAEGERYPVLIGVRVDGDEHEMAYVRKVELVDVLDESAKLRELMAELYQCSRQYGCDRCGYKDGCAMFDRMAQMGVEVEHE